MRRRQPWRILGLIWLNYIFEQYATTHFVLTSLSKKVHAFEIMKKSIKGEWPFWLIGEKTGLCDDT